MTRHFRSSTTNMTFIAQPWSISNNTMNHHAEARVFVSSCRKTQTNI